MDGCLYSFKDAESWLDGFLFLQAHFYALHSV